MVKFLRLSFFFLLTFLISLSGIAQQKNIKKINTEMLRKITLEQQVKYISSRNKALVLARKNKWIISETRPDGTVISLQGVSENGKPLYYTTYNNTTSATTTSTDQIWSGGAAGFNLNGASPLLKGKLGIWDGGAVRSSHQELSGRIVNRDGYPKISDHATHVAGTMIARGLSSVAKGMAFQAPNLQSWYFDNDAAEIAGAAADLLVSNHSYGYSAGWQNMGGKWYWLGDPGVSETDDVYFGYYDYTAQTWDNIAYNAPYYLMVKAAGNSRNMQEPAVDQPYYRLNPSTGAWDLITKRSAAMRSYTGYDVIPDHSVAKNILTVGAIQGLSAGYNKPSDVVSANFSSWGPTDDGRIKPDLVGNGISVVSANGRSDDAYAGSTGTSMAAPNISGSLFLLQEHYAKLNSGRFMRAATLKGLAIHTAQEAGLSPGPDYKHGWGILNTARAAKVLSNSKHQHQVSERTLLDRNIYTQNLLAAGSEPLRITIAWTDPPGNILPLEPATLNNRTPRLINDLDVRVTHGDETYLPWILDPDNPELPATTGDNIRDNVEQILIPNPVPGQNYTLTITHKEALENQEQDYSLIISGLQPQLYCSSAPFSANGSRLENVTIGLINNTTTNCTPYTDFTALATYAEAGQTLPVSLTLGTCQADAAKIACIFIDWNEDGDFADAQEAVFTSGIITGDGTIHGFIQVPTFIRAGNATRMRVIVSETLNANEIISCGTYNQGETEDYTVNLLNPSQDAEMLAISLPASGNFYAGPAQSITVKLRNNGSAPLTNIPVQVRISTNNITETLHGTYTGTLAAAEETSFVLPGTFTALPATTYTLSATANVITDQIKANNTFTTTLTTAPLSPAPIATATGCDASTAVILQGTGTGTLFWYDAPQGGNLLAVGNQTTTLYKPVDKTYYAALNDFSGTTATLQNEATGSFSNYTRDTIYFNAGAPFILDKVTLEAGAAGIITVNLIAPDKKIIAATQLQVTTGVAEYILDFLIPAAGNQYKLTVSAFGKGATANRHDGAGTITFPYRIANLLSVTGSSSATTYFYLYNWKIKAAGSPSTRTKVKANGTLVASASSVCSGNNAGTLTLTSFNAEIDHWEKSTDSLTWTAIAHTGAQLSFENLSQTTYFRTIMAEEDCASASSAPITVVVLPKPEAVISTGNAAHTISPGTPLLLTASAGTSYTWSTGDTTRTITVAAAGTYTVTVTNETGCSTTSEPFRAIADLVFWTGNMSTDWFEAGNWSSTVPDNSTNVIIPADLVNYPIITTGSATCKNLLIQGSLTIQSGTINITGNFINNGEFKQNSGTLELAGNSTQQITGRSFRNLHIKGGGTTMLNSDIIINGALTLTNGQIETGNHKIILIEAATLTETAQHYITGQVEATRTLDQQTITQDFGLMGMRISTTAAPGAVRVTRFTGTAATSMPGAVNRQYAIDVLSGKDAGLNATMEFSYWPHELQDQDKNQLALYRSADQGQTWTLQENSQPDQTEDSYKITLSGIDAFSTWTAASRNANTVLPVSLITFRAQKQKQDAWLTWETATETNSAGIAVEVATDATNYRQLKYIQTKGNNLAMRQQYEFLDQEAGKSGTRYYRLKQIDLDGKFVYYGPRVVYFNKLSNEIPVYPNPTSGTFTLVTQADAPGPLWVEIKNTAGQTVYVTQQQLNKGTNHSKIILPGHPKRGLYFVWAYFNHYQRLHKLMLD